MFFYVYVLESLNNGKIYTGYTSDLKRRLGEHNLEKNISTKSAAPWRVIHYEAYLNKEDAVRREGCLKTAQGIRLMKRMLKEYFYEKRSK